MFNIIKLETFNYFSLLAQKRWCRKVLSKKITLVGVEPVICRAESYMLMDCVTLDIYTLLYCCTCFNRKSTIDDVT
jgi:hypothetical protein